MPDFILYSSQVDFSLKLEFLLQSFKFLEFSFLTCRKFNLSCFSQPQNLLQAICHCLFVYCLLTLLLWIFICSDLALQVAAASKCFSLHSFTKHHVVVPVHHCFHSSSTRLGCPDQLFPQAHDSLSTESLVLAQSLPKG